MDEQNLPPQPNYIPYPTEEAALAKIAEIDAKNQVQWEKRSTETYAVPMERTDGNFYLPIISGYAKDFTEEELSRGVEMLPEPIEQVPLT